MLIDFDKILLPETTLEKLKKFRALLNNPSEVLVLVNALIDVFLKSFFGLFQSLIANLQQYLYQVVQCYLTQNLLPKGCFECSIVRKDLIENLSEVDLTDKLEGARLHVVGHK